MNEIAVRDEQPAAELAVLQEDNIARLARWAEQADSAVRIAEIVCNSTMAPKAYRGKPNEAAAAILAGTEIGFSPMASLRAFDDLMGTPAPKAITLRAIVQSRGHDLEYIETGPTRCVVEGRRKGSDRWQRLEWTIERAEQAGYVAKNPKWRTDPTAQLIARATAEMSRWLDSAAIMGLPYASEEIADAGARAQPPTRQVTAADIVGLAVTATTDEKPASQQQIQDIVELCIDQGLDPEQRRLKIEGIVGHTVQRPADLTSAEAEEVIAGLTLPAAEASRG